MRINRRLKPATDAARGLAGDDRGAILVIGIFMCTCLVAATWYLASIGDAILYRERMQEAADSVAFSNAALHARGMNLIVLINLVMACVLGVRVALKVTQLVMMIAAVTFAAIGVFVEIFLGASAACTEGASYIQDILDSTHDVINDTLKLLSKAQVGVARLTPGAAELASIEINGPKFSPLVSHNVVDDQLLLSGLPVVDGSAKKLCKEAGRSTGEIITWVLDKVGLSVFGKATKRLGEMIGSLASVSPDYFCEIGTSGTSPDATIDGMLDEPAQRQCENGGPLAAYDQAEKNWEDKCVAYQVQCVGTAGGDDASGDPYRTISPSGTQTGTTTPDRQRELDTLKKQRDNAASAANSYRDRFGAMGTDDEDACKQWSKDNSKRQIDAARQNQAAKSNSNNSSTASNSNDSSDDMLGKQVDSSWYNGAPKGQIVSVLTGDRSRLGRSLQLTRVGAVGDARASGLGDPLVASVPTIAQAEFFYDCRGTWESCNADEDAMWHFLWRARLRRYNTPSAESNAIDAITVAAATNFAAAILGSTDISQSANMAGAENAGLRGALASALKDAAKGGVH